MPRVLLDLRMVHGRMHGIARYALELARHLPRLAPTWSFVALTAPEGLPSALGPLRPDIELRVSHAEFLSGLEQPLLAASLLRARCDLFHATSFSVPALWPGRLVATLHDANHLALPELYGPGRIAYYRLIVGPRVRRANAVITVSEFSRRELARLLPLDAERIRVISNGVDDRFAPGAREAVEAFKARNGLSPRYFLAMGNPKPHKNLAVLAPIARELGAPLVVLAGRGAVAQLGFPDGTIELADADERDLPLLYAGAIALLLPSRYEGFGLPALEAMACGCPVIAADAAALPEVIGRAGVLVPAENAEAWKDAALRIARDESMRRSFIELGRERASRFSWETCARQTLAVYERALEQRS